MHKQEIFFRKGTFDDFEKLLSLYEEVAKYPGGIARELDEITEDYVRKFLHNSLEKGLIIVASFPGSDRLVGSIHAYRLGPKVFRHILGELTVVVHPEYQGNQIGKQLFKHFLNEVQNHYPSILRVELIARESNQKALSLYTSLGFIQEGRLEKRILPISGVFEADIPMAWFNPGFIKADTEQS